MSKVNDILNTAERLFDQQGFHSTGIDQIVKEAGVTPRTLYRHFTSKEQLILNVLEQREIRFLKQLEKKLNEHEINAPSWLIIISELEEWFVQESSKGCLFLRALAEYGHKDIEIRQRISDHKQRTFEFLKDQLQREFPNQLNEKVESLLLIIEGATALAPIIGGKAAAHRARLLANNIFIYSTYPLPH
ncbi:TetR/AcrR family transcriptional regulator [Acinetobacter vivianii]|uniref:TetR/AcrR family transcriptional regulator n=1 Tax=Acinetobacter vivianii TaxID=1776742 RepID=A0AAJ6P650_9GAMM|nr:TetR/AcrR family transcriptional regulator [Acinetobacter vivianii]WDZ52145.1 TetR/AcrR family transcriptional regulator [Acinetobacter vivianii]